MHNMMNTSGVGGGGSGGGGIDDATNDKWVSSKV